MCYSGCSKINVGEEYQAELGDCDEMRTGVEQDKDFSELVFMPLDNLSRDDEDTCKYFRLCVCMYVRMYVCMYVCMKCGSSCK